METKRLTKLALLTTVALIIFVALITIIIITIKEGNNIGILFNRPRFTNIR